MHTMPIDAFPGAWVSEAWANRRPPSLGGAPPVDDVVLVHGDACAPNTLIAGRSVDG
jgi:kanamycin kinase